MYLLDTNVVSELHKVKTGKANPSVCAWAQAQHANELFLSVISILEFEIGILQKERNDPEQGKRLRSWLEQQVTPVFEGRILSVDYRVVIECAKLHVPNAVSERDALIAATAKVHGLCVATRNTPDFKSTGVKTFNPWLD